MKRLPVGGRHSLGEFGLQAVNGGRSCSVTLPSQGSDDGVYGTPVVG